MGRGRQYTKGGTQQSKRITLARGTVLEQADLMHRERTYKALDHGTISLLFNLLSLGSLSRSFSEQPETCCGRKKAGDLCASLKWKKNGLRTFLQNLMDAKKVKKPKEN
jgi:hypothetical protein